MRLAVVDTERCVGCQCCMFACTRREGRAGYLGSCISVRSDGGMESGFVVVVCRACIDPPCAKVCPTNALEVKKKGGVRLKSDICIGCGNCKDACIIGAVFWSDDEEKPEICVQCGICAEFCPHGVLHLEKTGDSKQGTVGKD